MKAQVTPTMARRNATIARAAVRARLRARIRATLDQCEHLALDNARDRTLLERALIQAIDGETPAKDPRAELMARCTCSARMVDAALPGSHTSHSLGCKAFK